MKRRDVIRKVILGGTAFVLVPAGFNSCSKDDKEEEGPEVIFSIDLKDPAYAVLKNDGGSYVIPTKQIIVVNSGNFGYWAYDSQCPHNGCTLKVIWPPQANQLLICPCHSSIFDDFGKVLSGPATANVKEYNVSKEGDIITIKNS